MGSNICYLGIDVGTGSVRAGLIQPDGSILASATVPIQTWRDSSDHRIFEQSTGDIWNSICKSARAVLQEAGVPPSTVKGIGFDATCSLAVTDELGNPVAVTAGDGLGSFGERNIILWADHRAEQEADLINESGFKVLDYVGGIMSLEMQIPKILWLKRRMRAEIFAQCQFFDLPDFLTYRATGDNSRSMCSLTCKCSFVPIEGWQSDFFQHIGLADFVGNNYRQIGGASGKILTAGLPVGNGLSKESAQDLGLLEGTPVGSGVIDAYAGWLGTIAARHQEGGALSSVIPSLEDSKHRLAIVAGTSTCHIIQSATGIFVGGVWGPYRGVVFSDWWMNEGGQSATGQLIQFMITTHPAYSQLQELANGQNSTVHEVLCRELERLRVKNQVESLTELTKDMHFYPDLHGNRSPIGDSRMRGALVGLTLDDSLSDLARKFNLTLEAIALQTRHIVDEMNAKGHSIQTLYVSGGQTKNIPLMQLLANVCQRPVVLPGSNETTVVLGAAMLGRFASEVVSNVEGKSESQALWRIMLAMTPPGAVIYPSASRKESKLLEAKYRIFLDSIQIQKRWRQEMEVATE